MSGVIQTETMKLRGCPVTQDEAREAVHRLINSHFRTKDQARCTIPVRACDDDVTAIDYVIESAAEIEALKAQLSAMTEDRNLWRDAHNEDCPNAARIAELEGVDASILHRERTAANSEQIAQQKVEAVLKVLEMVKPVLETHIATLPPRSASRTTQRWRTEAKDALAAIAEVQKPFVALAGELIAFEKLLKAADDLRQAHTETSDCSIKSWGPDDRCDACKAYDALKGEGNKLG